MYEDATMAALLNARSSHADGSGVYRLLGRDRAASPDALAVRSCDARGRTDFVSRAPIRSRALGAPPQRHGATCDEHKICRTSL